MGYKLAIVRALSGKNQAAREILAGLDADKRQVLEASKERAMLVRQVAEAVLTADRTRARATAANCSASFSISSNSIRPTAIPAAGRPWNCNSSPPNCCSVRNWTANPGWPLGT